MAKLNKAAQNRKIIEKGIVQTCVKLQLDNIVFPKWSDIGLIGMMFRQCVSSKEQPDGHIYEEAKFQTVLRVLGGKVFMTGRPDTYCWGFEKVQNAKNVKAIGTNSAEGLITLCGVLNSISNVAEKKMLADMFANMKKDLLLVTTPEENRHCIEITQELYNAGITACVDEWMETDENGEAEATPLQIGDYLIITANGVYRIGRDEFMETHKLI